MDSPAIGPGLNDYLGLNLVSRAIVPHTRGSLPPSPLNAIARTLKIYGEQRPLPLMRDREALLVEDDVVRVV
jgi:peptidase E